MNILINASNQSGLGGVQVTDSFCRCLVNFPQHKFYVVLTDSFKTTIDDMKQVNNVETIVYPIRNSVNTILFGRDKFLDSLIQKYMIDGVITMFAPSRWNPKVPHFAGFALSQLVIPESPYYKILSIKESIRQHLLNNLWTYYFKKGTHFLYTENPFITRRLIEKWPSFQVITITNYYNQVFDNPSRWIEKKLPDFSGTTILTLSRNDKHKHVDIIPEICKRLKDLHPDFLFRFVLPETEDKYPIEESLKPFFCLIGKIPIESCPSIYSQCDISFQPTLLECFTATFPEAMRMKKPIIACNLEFAKGLCGDAALYFDWDNPDQAAELIYKVATNKDISNQLVEAGTLQLKNYDDYMHRSEKLINAIERLISQGSIM